MIKIDIDFSNATQSEIDELYRIPGLQDALSRLQTHNRQYNAVVTVHQPGNQLVEVKVLLMEFMRGHNMKAGNVIPVKPYQFTFVPSLNAKQQSLLGATLNALVQEGVLIEEGGNYRLTELGFEALY